MCPKCFYIHDKNRNGKSFVCTVCKHKDDADHNAAVNIGQRAFDEEVIEIVEKFPYNTNKRHKASKSYSNNVTVALWGISQPLNFL